MSGFQGGEGERYTRPGNWNRYASMCEVTRRGNATGACRIPYAHPVNAYQPIPDESRREKNARPHPREARRGEARRGAARQPVVSMYINSNEGTPIRSGNPR